MFSWSVWDAINLALAVVFLIALVVGGAVLWRGDWLNWILPDSVKHYPAAPATPATPAPSPVSGLR
jgi:hypothetical protein